MGPALEANDAERSTALAKTTERAGANMKPGVLRAELRRALKGGKSEGVKLMQRGEDTYLARTSGN